MDFINYLLFCIVWAVAIYGLYLLVPDGQKSYSGFIPVAILMCIPSLPLLITGIILHKVWLYLKDFPTIFKKNPDGDI